MSELDDINRSIEQAKKNIEKAKKLKRLQENKDFQELITKGYLYDYPAELVQSKALPQTQTSSQQKYIDYQLAGVGGFVVHMDLILTMGITAEASLKSDETEKAYLLEEEIV
jgi:hypothetical protein